MLLLYSWSCDWISLLKQLEQWLFLEGAALEQHQSHLVLLMGHGQGAGEVSAA